jgi:hypothetical protein
MGSVFEIEIANDAGTATMRRWLFPSTIAALLVVSVLIGLVPRRVQQIHVTKFAPDFKIFGKGFSPNAVPDWTLDRYPGLQLKRYGSFQQQRGNASSAISSWMPMMSEFSFLIAGSIGGPEQSVRLRGLLTASALGRSGPCATAT